MDPQLIELKISLFNKTASRTSLRKLICFLKFLNDPVLAGVGTPGKGSRSEFLFGVQNDKILT